MKYGAIALLALALSAIAGCEVYDEPGVGLVAGPAVFDTWYWGGYYDNGFWVYRDHDGHWFREGRAAHEGRERSYYGHVGGHEFHGGGHVEAHGGGGSHGGGHEGHGH